MKRLLFLLPIALFAVTFPTAHNDQGQTGANPHETLLTPQNVTAASFRKVGTYSVDGLIWAQPLFIPAVMISGRIYDLLIVATMNNSVYAFDASNPGSTALWHTALSGSPRTSYPNVTNCGGTCDPTQYGTPIGIMATPVVDPVGGFIYVTNTNTTPTWVLSQLSLTTGNVLQSTTITGTVTGTGDPTGGDTVSGGVLSFYPAFELNRSGLALANGKVYIAFTSYGDIHPWHGWLFAYNTSDLSRAAVFCASPNTYGAGIWESGGAPAVDSSGNLYVSTGNDSYDGLTAFGESVLRFSPSLSLLDWFTPSNYASLDSSDADLSSGRPMLIPGTHSLVISGKDFNAYLLDTTCMGHLQGSSSCSLQTFKTCASCTVTGSSGAYGSLFLNSSLYLPTTGGSLYAFGFSAGSFTITPFATSLSNSWGFPGPAQLAGSPGIVWVTTSTGSTENTQQQGTLRALDAFGLTELWNSDQGTGNALGHLAKFTAPTIANGRVFVPNQDSQVQVFGLTSTSTMRGNGTLRGSASLR